MNREDGKPSTSFTAQRRLSPPPESMRARSSSTTAIHRSKKSAPRGEHDTQSQQVNLESPTRSGLMKRALSFQFRKSKEVQKLDSETIAKIKIRYKDVSKFLIWPECSFPEEHNRGYVTFNQDKSKRSAIRYSHAGNHQAAVLRLNAAKWSDAEVRKKLLSGELDTSAFVHPDGFNEGKSKFYHQSPSVLRRSDLASVAEEQQRMSLMAEKNIMDKRVANIEDDQTPALPHTINSIRRSESSDEEESIIGITAHSDDVFLGDGDEDPDFRVLRL